MSLDDEMVYGSGFTFSGKKSKRFPYGMYRWVNVKQFFKKLKKDKKMYLNKNQKARINELIGKGLI